MNGISDQTREFASIAMVFVAVVVAIWGQRRRLRPWYFAVAGTLAVVSITISLVLANMAKAGEFTGWGGILLVMFLLPAALLAASSVTALITMTALLPFYGFDTRTREQRRAEQRFRRSPVGQRIKAKRELTRLLIMLALVLLAVQFTQLRSRGLSGPQATPQASAFRW